MATPMKNQYRSKTMIGNWYEERCIRDATIEAYLEKKAVNDERAAQLEIERDNLDASVPIDGSKSDIINHDNLVIVNHNTFPMSLSCDPRYTSRDVPEGRIVSLSVEILPTRRHTFHIHLVSRSNTKYGNRDPKSQSIKFSNDEPIRYGDRFYLICSQEMIDIAIPAKAGITFALACPQSYSEGSYLPIIAPLDEMKNAAEFTIEPYQRSDRLEGEGLPAKYDELVILRHCLSGQCISSGENGPIKKPMDLPTQEFEVECKSCLNSHKHEDECCAISFTAGGTLDDDK